MSPPRRKPASAQPMLPGLQEESAAEGSAAKVPSPRGSAEKGSSPKGSSARGPAPAGSTGAAAAEQGSADPAQLGGKTVYVVDAHSLIFQVFHALPGMTSPGGQEVGAVYGFLRDVLYLLEEKRPDYLFCAFDLPGPTFRHAVYPEYKADRGEMPEELRPQFPLIRELLGTLGVPSVDCENYEADDILATIARVCDEQQARCLLVTGDKDCRQLISDHVRVYNVRKDQEYDAAALQADWGVKPEQVVDFQALVGDKVDNVPGVPLIGPKIASELLGRFGTLDEVLDKANEVSGTKRKQNLLEGREQALLSRVLVRLDRHVPVEIDWSSGRVGGIDQARAAELFAAHGFRSFGERLARLDAGGASPPEWETDYQRIDTTAKLLALLKKLAGRGQIAVDTETTDVRPRWAEIVGVSLAWEEGKACYVPLRAPAGEQHLDPAVALPLLAPLLADASIEKVGQNLKYDMIVLRGAGAELSAATFDTMVASYLLDAGERNHRLDDLSRRYLHHAPTPITELIGSGKQQKRMDEVPVDDVTHYAAEDADLPLRLRPLLEPRLAETDLVELFRDVEMPLIEVLAELEWNGIRVDRARLAALSADYGARLETLEGEIYALAGHEFNIASPKQLATVLFDELELPVLKKTKTGASTDADVLAQLAHQHDLPARIIEYRQYAKLKNTYVDALPQLVHPETGRVHASFNQVVTATGRLSSSDPNLQNIPVRSESGREIRSAFLPAEGWKLLAADYSQIELRVLAHFSGDEALTAAFEADEDIHTRVASEVFGVDQTDVTSDMRRTAKAVNFGVIYGQSPFGLAAALDIEQDEAARFIDAYFARYAGVEEFLAKTLESAARNGYVKTVLGRRRAIRGIRADRIRSEKSSAEGGRQRNLPERTAINTVVQGSAADLIKLAMVSIHRRLRHEELTAKMLLQIHDELIFEVSSDRLEYLGELVSDEMAGVLQLAVPLKVDLKSGDNWADCEPW